MDARGTVRPFGGCTLEVVGPDAGATVVVVGGDIDAPEAAELESTLLGLLDAASLVVVDLGGAAHFGSRGLTALLRTQMKSLERTKARLSLDILNRIRAEADLLARFRLLTSLPGIGPIVAASLVIRMPELGEMKRGQAASLIGVAPFDRDSGQWKGQRFIAGGRARPRRMLYLAAVAAKRFDPGFKAFAQRLLNNGKPRKLITVAVMRKLIEAANLVLSRRQPWLKIPAT